MGLATVTDLHAPMYKLVTRELIGLSIQRIYEIIGKAASTNATVLISGETGTGKELVARAIHQNSYRDQYPFVPVNCAGLPENILESELFGHRKGAFTGAVYNHRGLFAEAYKGTLFLDEIAEMSPHLQAKLLRAVQNGEIRPVGSTQVLYVDTRIIAATNKDLEAEVRKGHFRDDLYYRLNVIRIVVPPLRDRVEDIPELVKYFIKKYSDKDNRVPIVLDEDAIKVLQEGYHWPGNVRELETFIERLVALEDEHESTGIAKTISGADVILMLPKTIVKGGAHYSSGNDYGSLAEVERNHILKVLEQCGGNRTQAARILGINTRTIFRKLSEYSAEGIQFPPTLYRGH